jgi:MFS family permease
VSAPFVRAERRAPPAPPPPFAYLFREPALWKMGVAHFCSNYGFYFTLSWMPLYLTQVRGYSIGQMTAIASLGVVTPIVAPVIGHLSDQLIARGAGEDAVRRTIMIVSQAAGALSIAGMFLSQTTGLLIFWSVIGAIGTSGVATNIFAVGQIFGGARATGGWMGVQNTFGNLSGIIGPIITGLIIDRLGGFGWGFALAAGVGLLGAIWWALVIPPMREVEVPLAMEPALG